MPGSFPADPIQKGKALGTRLSISDIDEEDISFQPVRVSRAANSRPFLSACICKGLFTWRMGNPHRRVTPLEGLPSYIVVSRGTLTVDIVHVFLVQ